MAGGMSDADFEKRAELIQQLLLEAGRLMEDASPELALGLPVSLGALNARIIALDVIADDLAALAAAARLLLCQISWFDWSFSCRLHHA